MSWPLLMWKRRGHARPLLMDFHLVPNTITGVAQAGDGTPWSLSFSSRAAQGK